MLQIPCIWNSSTEYGTISADKFQNFFWGNDFYIYNTIETKILVKIKSCMFIWPKAKFSQLKYHFCSKHLTMSATFSSYYL